MRVAILLFLPITLFGQLKVSTDGHYLTKQDGTPVLLSGSAPWTINTNLTFAEMRRFADSSAAYQINYWQVMALTPSTFGGSANEHGENPWTNKQNYGGTPNEKYWMHLDSVIAFANTKGIYIMLYPTYLGASGDNGFADEVASATFAEMYAWGQFMGARYARSQNILWGIAGDLDPTPYQAKLDTMVAGILSQDPNHLISTRDQQRTTTNTYWAKFSWVTLRGTYPYWSAYVAENIYLDGWDLYNQTPHRPATLQEAWYENEHGSTPAQLRQQSYYAILSGLLAGQIFGNCPEWHFSEYSGSLCGAGKWAAELNSQGHKNQKWFSKLFNSRYWWKLIPDSANAVTTVGYGSGANYVVTAYASDRSSIIAYFPASRTVTINPAVLVGDSVRVRWFNPSNGVVIFAGNQRRANIFQVAPPSTSDWVLVVDSENFDSVFDKPGGRTPRDIPGPVNGEDLQPSEKFYLVQNYPNPFNPETTIVYSLPSSGFVELIVFNVDGKKVATLVSTFQPEGRYSVKFNARMFSSGLYFCSLKTNKLVDTIKLLVLK